jgi:hypothetical protein
MPRPAPLLSESMQKPMLFAIEQTIKSAILPEPEQSSGGIVGNPSKYEIMNVCHFIADQVIRIRL